MASDDDIHYLRDRLYICEQITKEIGYLLTRVGYGDHIRQLFDGAQRATDEMEDRYKGAIIPQGKQDERMTDDPLDEIEALEAEMERVRALAASNMAAKRSGKASDLTINLEAVSPSDVQAMAMAAIPALLEKAYRLAMSDRAALDSVLKCANMFMERAMGRPKEHIEVKVSTADEARAALELLTAEGVVAPGAASSFLSNLGVVDVEFNQEDEFK